MFRLVGDIPLWLHFVGGVSKMVEKMVLCKVNACYNVCHILDTSGLSKERMEKERLYLSFSNKYWLSLNYYTSTRSQTMIAEREGSASNVISCCCP
jgi:hypothetical protein